MFGDGIGEIDTIHSFLMIGQSNMAGRGDFGEVEPIHNPNCFMLRMGRWQEMREPINPDRAIFEGQFRSGVCLAASFADELANDTGLKIGLIPCADGGTRMDEWQPGGILFDHAVMMAKLAMRTSRLCGIIWHQGESDCGNLDEAEYRRLFLNTMSSLRAQLGLRDIPLIIGELSEKISPEFQLVHIPRMNALLHRLQEELPLCGIASAENLSMKADGLHFDSKALRELGKRYFAEYKKIALSEKTLGARSVFSSQM